MGVRRSEADDPGLGGEWSKLPDEAEVRPQPTTGERCGVGHGLTGADEISPPGSGCGTVALVVLAAILVLAMAAFLAIAPR